MKKLEFYKTNQELRIIGHWPVVFPFSFIYDAIKPNSNGSAFHSEEELK